VSGTWLVVPAETLSSAWCFVGPEMAGVWVRESVKTQYALVRNPK